MKRVAVFAHYDVHNIIQDYVVYYIKELQKVAEKIIFVSDCELSEAELSKISPYVVQSIAYHHGEYDFGSYKRGYQWAKENGLFDDCEEFILANDSCYAPLFPFSEMFSKMSIKELDFWGVTANSQGFEIVDGKPIANFQDHIQSYFIVFKPQVFKSDVFDNFIASIKKEKTKEEVIVYYEVGLSKLLVENGFKYDVYCELSKRLICSHVLAYKKLIANNKSPFLKRNIILFKVLDIACPTFTKNLIKKYTQYDYTFIKKDRKRNCVKKGRIIKEYIKAARKSVIRIHFKEKEVYFLGNWYSLRKEKDEKDTICNLFGR